ncbi:MAG: hypothetical protein AUJ52_08110 [Elusimicrobia bacterium CG1_02_63_36]|nr:MAG: hypothetical protein AUJ52_08110 [Elusimicrobia bacterium CG1_02_63_36]
MVFRYSPDIVSAAFREKGGGAVEEVGPQIHKVPLLTPAFCRDIVNATECVGRWETEAQNDRYLPRVHDGPEETVPTRAKPYACRFNPKEQETACDADFGTKSVFSIQYADGLFETFNEIIDRHLLPVAAKIWPTYRMRTRRIPYVLRYDAQDKSLHPGMNLHWEQMAFALAVYLNDDFDGGGTYFPRWKLVTGRGEIGTAIFYPGGVSHEHGALDITRGRRYVLICDFY